MIRDGKFYGVLIAVVLFLILPIRSESLPRNIVNLMLDENYRQALRELETLEDQDEKLFGQAMIALRQERFRKADERFRELINRYPESPRSIDADYYLDTIKMRSSNPRPPTVRVRLAQGEKLSGTLTGPATVKSADGTRITELRAGEKWIMIPTDQKNVMLRISDRNRAFKPTSKIIFRPRARRTKLAHDGVRYRGRFEFRPSPGGEVNLINELSVKKYLYGVVRKEIAPNWPMATVKAQAVAARSFVVTQLRQNNGSFDVKSSHLSQVYGGFNAETDRVRDAVKTTSGEVLTHRGTVVPAYFHANSGGYVETAEDVWNQSKTPYIVSKPDSWSRKTNHSRWTAKISRNKLLQSLRRSSLPDAESPLTIETVETLPSGRSKILSYSSQSGSRTEVGANDFRLAIGPGKLKSTWFTEIEHRENNILFHGRGWGHGVGLSQWGAKAMAETGFSHQQILRFYYENARLMGSYGLGAKQGEGLIDD